MIDISFPEQIKNILINQLPHYTNLLSIGKNKITNVEIENETICKITTEEPHSLSSLVNYDTVNVCGIWLEHNVNSINLDIKRDTMGYFTGGFLKVNIDGAHNIDQQNIIAIKFQNLNEEKLNDYTFYFSPVNHSANNSFYFRLEYQDSYFDLENLTGANIKIQLLLHNSKDKNINRNLQKEDITIIDNNTFSYAIDYRQKNPVLSYSDDNLPSSLCRNIDFSLIDTISLANATDKGTDRKNYMYLYFSGLTQFDDKEDSNGVNGAFSETPYLVNINFFIFFKQRDINDNRIYTLKYANHLKIILEIILAKTIFVSRAFKVNERSKGTNLKNFNTEEAFTNQEYCCYRADFTFTLTKNISFFNRSNFTFTPDLIQIKGKYTKDGINFSDESLIEI